MVLVDDGEWDVDDSLVQEMNEEELESIMAGISFGFVVDISNPKTIKLGGQ